MPGLDRRYPIDEVARRGDEIYNRDIRASVEGKDDGKVVAIDVDTGFYAVDDSVSSAVEKVRENNPAAEVWLVRVGKNNVTRIGCWRDSTAT